MHTANVDRDGRS